MCSAAGLVAVGDKKKGRACVEDGGVCNKAAKTDVKCSPPSALGKCSSSIVDSSSAGICTKCTRHTWKVGPGCKPRLTCDRGEYVVTATPTDADAVGPCSCGATVDGCAQCEVRKEPAPKPYYPDTEFFDAADGLYKQCTGCGLDKIFYQGGCLDVGTCPEGMTNYYVPGKLVGTCRVPFQCLFGKSTADKKACRCRGTHCNTCTWLAEPEGYKCVECKHNKYLLNGDCVDAAVCISAGLLPLGDQTKGRVCVPAS